MIEIESKFKLSSNITCDNLIAILKSQFVAPISSKHQIDTIFLLPEQVDAPIVPGSKIMRVRDTLDPVDKIRLESKTKDYTICIDEVTKLGLFIELEVLAEDDANAGDIQRQMHIFLKNLNIDGKLWTIPYDTSIRNLSIIN